MENFRDISVVSADSIAKIHDRRMSVILVSFQGSNSNYMDTIHMTFYFRDKVEIHHLNSFQVLFHFKHYFIFWLQMNGSYHLQLSLPGSAHVDPHGP